MTRTERTVLHVLPHPGGGGETYVDALSQMDGYRASRIHLAPSPRAADALPALPRSVARVLASARRHDLVHVHGEVASTICLPSLALRPSVVTFNGLHLLRRVTGARRRAAEMNLRLIVRAATRTICVADTERDEVLAIVGPRAAASVHTIYNGVRLLDPPTEKERAAMRAELGLRDDVVAGISVAALDEHKDPLTAARAAVEVAREGVPLVLMFVGDGPLRPELERLAAGPSAGAVRVLGFRRDVEGLLGAADFFVLPSLREGLSFALLEAMSLGLPAVVSDAPGNAEAVADAGIVVPRGDVATFAVAYRQLANAEERSALGTGARTRVAAEFAVDRMVIRTRDLYDEVVAAVPRPIWRRDRPTRAQDEHRDVG
jgi:glycosyltransferase involved in cell wall biosynthesis